MVEHRERKSCPGIPSIYLVYAFIHNSRENLPSTVLRNKYGRALALQDLHFQRVPCPHYTPDTPDTIPPREVDKLMSEDIQRILATELRKSGDGAQGSQPLDLSPPSPGRIPSEPAHRSGENYLRHGEIAHSDDDTVHIYKDTTGKPQDGPRFLLHSLALDPPAYTGSAELRGEIATTPLKLQQVHQGTGFRFGQVRLLLTCTDPTSAMIYVGLADTQLTSPY